MKRFVQSAVMVIFIALASSSPHAYTVDIDNDMDGQVEVITSGEHLFWKQIDCRATVAVITKGGCDMPGGAARRVRTF